MFYYLVWVRSNRYHGSEPLTYSSEQELRVGQVVKVELQNMLVLGFVVNTTSRPKFKTKPISYVYALPPLPKSSLDLAGWLKEYYPAPLGIVAQQFLPANIPTIAVESEAKSISKAKIELPPLNDGQKKAVSQIKNSGTYLLHGRTGTGKTRVYVEEAIKTIKEGKSVIVLSPEIGLSSQLFENFSSALGGQVITMHSRQTPKERLESWLRCLRTDKPLIVIGPRSALFSPLSNIGLIVVDEVHDGAYKQEQLPHYQAVRVASALAQLTKSKLVLGSATPSVSDYFLATAKSRPVIELTKLAKGKETKSDVHIVDLKDRANFTSSVILSDQLIESIKKALTDKQQSLIFLNRRGTSRLILCEDCGWEALCPNCELPLVYHGDQHQLRCHTCGFIEKTIPTICPNCSGDSILYTTAGTKAVASEVQKLFTQANIRRFDTDNLKADSIGQLYQSVLSGEVDILIGTQQLAKGFDLPKLATVGILQADSNLYLPDYTSEERSFQLITQVLGRIGRGHLQGRAIIQTHNPSSPLLASAISQNYKEFYEKEISDRLRFKLPPFYSLLKISCHRASSKSAEAACINLKALISQNSGVQIEGPAPSFHEKSQGKYQWQLVVKATNRKHLIDVIKLLPTGWTHDIDPANLL
ncbi:MAG TPA: primosomal protein N' [Candidatus Saccharimonadales bacterium]|jgi:primosomal protein N' (replication factor Y)